MKADHEEPAAERQFESRIPRFDTINEGAAFWAAHSLTEWADEPEVVTDVKFVRAAPESQVTVHLGRDTLQALSGEARNRGIHTSALAEEWILERPAEAEQRAHPGSASG